MDTNKMRDISREQFEQRYPVPEGCCWNAEQGRYVLFHLKLCTLAKYERFVENWVCWQASREAVVLELPNAYESAPPYACYELGWNDMRGEAVDAVEAQGLKVAP